MNRLRLMRGAGLVLMDCVFMLLSWVAAVALYSYLFSIRGTRVMVLLQYWYILCIVNAGTFMALGVYRNIWLYAGLPDLLRITIASLISSFAVYVIYKLIGGVWQSPAIAMLAFYILLTCSGGIRLLPKLRRDLQRYFKRPKGEIKRVLVVGAGHSASMLLREIQQGRKPFKVLGLVDDNPDKLNMQMHGVKVLGNVKNLNELALRMQAEEILIAIPSATNEELNNIVAHCPLDKCRVRLINSINDASRGLEGLRDLDVADLLGREETRLEVSRIAQMVKDKTVMVTGGGGSIGSELLRQLISYDPYRLVVLDMYENNAYNLYRELCDDYRDKADRLVVRIGNVQDTARLEQVFEEYRPSIVFHAAAYKHVPLMENCPELAIRNNVLGTAYTAALSIRHGVEKFVMISTDKAVNPTNVMGASKRLAERVVLAFNEAEDRVQLPRLALDVPKDNKTEFVCVRFGNVLGSNGSVVPIFQHQIETGGPVTVTHPDITRYFMTIPEAARLVLQATCMAKGGEIFILDMGEPVKILDLARNMIRIAGLVPDADIKIEFTGLRPGEKLYEELLLDTKGAKKTDSDRIFVAHPRPDHTEEIEKMLDILYFSDARGDDMKACVAELEPTYKPEDRNGK